MYSKHRLEALSDGIFAIAMTLLVLDLKVPTGVQHGELWRALTHDNHAWISFVITFGIAARFWLLQHRVFDVVETVGPQTALPTFVFLGFISILPFSTSLWGQHLTEPLAFSLYFLNQFAIALALVSKLELARTSGHLCSNAETSIMRLELWTMCLAMAAAGLGAMLFPLTYIGIVPAIFAVAMRRIRKLKIKQKGSIAKHGGQRTKPALVHHGK